jgi:hypothetical protein
MMCAAPSLAQTVASDPGAMSCGDYVKASKNSLNGAFGNVDLDDAEAAAEFMKMGQKIVTICSKNPKITVRQAIQQVVAEMD